MSQFSCGWTVWPQTRQPLHLGQHVWTHIFSTSRSFVYAINGFFWNTQNLIIFLIILYIKKRDSSQYFASDAHNVLLRMKGFSFKNAQPCHLFTDAWTSFQHTFASHGQQARGINGPELSMSPLTNSHPLRWVWLDKWRNGPSTAQSSVYWNR